MDPRARVDAECDAGSCRALDRRSAPARRVLRIVCRRFERAVEADDGSLGYLLERAGAVLRLSSRSGRRVDGRFERAAARDFDARAASGRIVHVHAARRLSVSIERDRRAARFARRLLRRRGATRRRRRTGVDQSHARRARIERDARIAARLRHRFGYRPRAGANARAVRRERQVRSRDDRCERARSVAALAASGLRARAVGKQLRIP